MTDQPHLTARELQVLQCLTRGLRYQSIGKELEISTRTVRAHVYAAQEKMQAVSVLSLVYMALEKGLLAYPVECPETTQNGG
jgi:two-component system nitrate/nitrite response regulator NarL